MLILIKFVCFVVNVVSVLINCVYCYKNKMCEFEIELVIFIIKLTLLQKYTHLQYLTDILSKHTQIL
jgi:hypothetical protein